MMDELRQRIEDALLAGASLPPAARVPGAVLYPGKGVAFGPDRPFVCAIGVFDGLHIGHRALIAAAREDARARGVHLALVTFDPDPSEVLSTHNPQRLCASGDRVRALALEGPDLIIAFDFTFAFSRNSYEAFTLDILGSLIKPVSIHVGEDFHFGADGAGSPADIARLGAGHGFSACGHALIERGGAAVSSTRIRALIKEGRLADARLLLGRDYALEASVHGEEGIQTLVFDDRACVPASGTYACALVAAGAACLAAVSVDAASCCAYVIPSCALIDQLATCSAVFLGPLPELGDTFSQLWVDQTNITIGCGEVGA